MKKTVCRALATAALTTAMALVSIPASADFLDFTVHEGTVTGALVNDFEADKVEGGYAEIITFDGAGNFSATLIVDFTGYFANEGVTPVASQVSVPPGIFPQQYGLYGVYTATGTVSPDGTDFRFDTTTAQADIYIDPALDTTKTLPGVGGAAPTIADLTNDDYKILTASTIYFEDNFLTPGVGGFFDIRFSDPTLTAVGCPLCGISYWEFLVLNLRATVDGDFDTFAVAGTQTISGELSLVFDAPEPASMALLGMGLLGTGLVARRRRRRSSV